MLRSVLLALAILALMISPAQAYQSYNNTSRQPDLISLSVGWWDLEKQEARQAVDFRGEYRWGITLLPESWKPYVQMHPFLGIEGTTQNFFYGLGGFAFDFPIGQRLFITWSEAVGGVASDGQPTKLGSVIEFRSQAEVGWRFENEMRLGLAVSHISNAGIGSRNPGAEIGSLYLHLPVNMIFRK